MDSIIKWMDRYWWAVSAISGAIVLVGVMLLSVGQSVWFDEGYSLLLAKSEIDDLLSLTAVDAHPPLYYLLLRGWGLMFGFEESTLRLLSAIFAGITVWLGLMLTRRLMGFRAAIFAVPVVVFSPFLLRYGYELRMYSLAAMIGVAATYALVLAWQTRATKWWAAYAVLVALGMYTLYMMIGLWLAHLIWLVWMSVRNKDPFKNWRWVWACAGAVLLFVPYMVTFFGQLTHSVASGVGTQVTLTKLIDLFSTLFVYLPEWRVNGWMSILLLVLIVGLALLFAKVLRVVSAAQRPYLVLFMLLVIVPLALGTVMSLPPLSPMFLPRYMAHVAPWVYLLVAVVVGICANSASLRRRSVGVYSVVAVVLLIGVGILARDGNVTFERVQSPKAYELRQEFDRQGLSCDDNVAVVADGPYVYIDTVFYFEDCNPWFYATSNLEYRGGYAPLSGSSRRIADTQKITDEYLIHLRGANPLLSVDERYKLVKSVEHDRQFIDIYRLVAKR